jgi:integrase
MPKLKMTDAAVQRIIAGAGERVDYFDAHPRDRQRGLVLRVSGSKLDDGSTRVTRAWAVLCRLKGSDKLRRFTIGDYPTYSLAEARDAAGEIIKQANRGIDPLKERDKAQHEAEIAGKDTIEALVEKFMGDLAKRPKKNGGKRSARYIEETQRNFDNHVLPRWRLKNIRDVGRREVSDLLDAVADEGTVVRTDGDRRHVRGGAIASNRTLAAIRGFLNWATDRGVIDTNPAMRVEVRGEETRRERVLSDDEIRIIWPEFGLRGYPFGMFYQLALLTAQRRDEVAAMQWTEVDEKEKTWTLPPERTKSGRPHAVPLSATALSIIAEAKKAGADLAKAEKRAPGRFVFSTTGTTPISGYSRSKARLDEDVERAARKARELPEDEQALRKALKLKPQEKVPQYVPDWTIHDLRRSVATKMAALGISQFDIARVLNHSDRSVTAIYNRHAYLVEKRRALDLWANRLNGIITDSNADIVPIRKGA